MIGWGKITGRGGQENLITRWSRWVVRHRKLVLALWVLLAAAMIPLAFSVTKHLTANGFETPHSQVQWATNRLNELHPPAAPQPLLIQGAKMRQVAAWVKPTAAARTDFHYIARGRTLFIPPAGFTIRDEIALKHTLNTHHQSVTAVTQLAVGRVVTHDASQTIAQSGLVAMPVLAVLLLSVFGSVLAVSLPLIVALAGAELALAAVSVISLHLQLSVFLTDIVSFLALGVGVDYALFISTRFRQNLRASMAVEDAVVDSMSHAGRSVLFSGIAVGLAVSMLFFGDNAYWRGLAVGGAVALFSVLIATHTLLPAVMGSFGTRVNWGRVRAPDFGLWRVLSGWVKRHPVWAIIISLAVLLPFAQMAPQIRMSTPANLATMLPRSAPLRQAVAKQQQIQGAGAIAPIAVVMQLDRPLTAVTSWQAVARVTRHLSQFTGVQSVSSATHLGLSPAQLAALWSEPGHIPARLHRALQNFVSFSHPKLAVVYVVAKSGPNSAASSALVGRIDRHVERWLPAGSRAAAGGLVPVLRSFNATTARHLPLMVAGALIVALVVLTAATGSLLQAFLGVIFDGMVALATAGFLVWINQHHWFGFEGRPLDSSITPLIFVLLFGLSMDYEVILLHRIQERWASHGPGRETVRSGSASTGPMITGAGMVMVAVFLALLISPLSLMKTLGLGLAFAVLVDTWIVRSLLVPATTMLLGRQGFWPWQPKHPQPNRP